MTRKSKKFLDGQDGIPEADYCSPIPEAAAEQPAYTVTAPEATVQAPAANTTQTIQVRKKRVRIRKKTTKHLSVAVLCTNPVTRRFI